MFNIIDKINPVEKAKDVPATKMLAPNSLNIFLFLGILHRCLETAFLTWLLLVKPIPERIKYRFFFFKTIGFSLLKCVLLVL